MSEQQLEQDVLCLAKIVERMQQEMRKVEEQNTLLIRANKSLIEKVEQSESFYRDFERNCVYEISDFRQKENSDFWYPEILSGEKAIDRIVNERASMARFGDGEFAAIAGVVRHRFLTEGIEEIGKRLVEVLGDEVDNLLIGIADNYGSLAKYSESTKREIRHYLSESVRKQHMKLLDKNRIYYDAYMTRPYISYADQNTEAPARRFANLKRIWDNRNCIFVEGNMTGLGVGNDLFDNAASIQRILVPAENAFLRYDEILAECRKQHTDVLFLLAAGPTATVLAYDLCKLGYQAVDIGHIDLEYEWFLRGEGHRVVIPGKYSNEMPGQEVPEQKLDDPSYFSQIIADYS